MTPPPAWAHPVALLTSGVFAKFPAVWESLPSGSQRGEQSDPSLLCSERPGRLPASLSPFSVPSGQFKIYKTQGFKDQGLIQGRKPHDCRGHRNSIFPRAPHAQGVERRWPAATAGPLPPDLKPPSGVFTQEDVSSWEVVAWAHLLGQ